jgi:hypothetical protein
MRKNRLKKNVRHWFPALTAAQAMKAHCDCITRLLASASDALTAETVDRIMAAAKKINTEAAEIEADCGERF